MDYSVLHYNSRNTFVLKIHFSNKEDGKLKVRCWSLSEEGKDGRIFKGKSGRVVTLFSEHNSKGNS